MRRWWVLTAVCFWSFGIAFSRPSVNPIIVDATTRIYSGDAWELELTVEDATAGDSVEVALINGLRSFESVLQLGTGGVARWAVPAMQITQAGESLVFIRYGSFEMRRTLEVLPQEATTVDLFATLNTLPAYGEGTATVLMLPRDTWGNAPEDARRFRLDVQYPSGERITYPFTYEGGLGRYTLTSHGGPGRVRLSMDEMPRSAALELMQSPGRPTDVTLTLSPECVLNDGRDIISLNATVVDSHGQPVAEGTLVTFSWDDGMGYGRTVNGQASLRLPAPTDAGVRHYRALAGEEWSAEAELRITEGSCSDAQ